jgi:hypothetical protein
MGRSVALLLGFLVACGGAGASLPPGSSDAGQTVDSNQGTPGDSAGGGDASQGDAGPCPQLGGAYGSIQQTGQGCGDFNALARECVKQTQCDIKLTSTVTTGPAAVNGEAQLDMAGSIAGASVTLGTVQRSGCTGSWNPSTDELTLDCGGMGTGQSCAVTMTRSSPMCP